MATKNDSIYVDSIQFTKENYREVCGFLNLITFDDLTLQIEEEKEAIKEGIKVSERALIDGYWRDIRVERAYVGDWIIKLYGKYYVLTDEEFKKL